MIVHAVECRSDCGNFHFCQGNYSKQGTDLVRQIEKIKTWLCANYRGLTDSERLAAKPQRI